MSTDKLTPIQAEIVSIFRNDNTWRTPRSVGANLRTMEVLVKKGFMERRREMPVCEEDPREVLEYRLRSRKLD